MLTPQTAPALLSSATKLIVLEKVKGTENPHHREHNAAAQCKVLVHIEAPGRELTYRSASALNPTGAESHKAEAFHLQRTVQGNWSFLETYCWGLTALYMLTYMPGGLMCVEYLPGPAARNENENKKVTQELCKRRAVLYADNL